MTRLAEYAGWIEIPDDDNDYSWMDKAREGLKSIPGYSDHDFKDTHDI